MRKLKSSDLKKMCDPSEFPFKSTEDFDFEHEPVHQERGVNSVDFGLNIRSKGYNIFVCGATGTGRNTLVKKAVNDIAGKQAPPDDWIYIYNFINEYEPIAIRLPAGRGIIFKKDMEELVDELKVEIPRAFESEDYETRKQELLKEYKKRRDTTIEEIENGAYEEGFVLKQSATGVILVPRVGERAMSTEEFEQLTDKKKEKIDKKKNELHIKIEQVLAEVRTMEKAAKSQIKDLEREVALFAVKHVMDELRFKYREFEDITEYLNHVQEDIVKHIDIFKEEEQDSQFQIFGGVPGKSQSKKNVFQQYDVNLLVDHRHSKGAPVILEANPNYYNLLGRIEYVSQFGSMTTDFTMIAPGALHKANGGYLILQAMDVLTSFMAWDALKRVIRNSEIKVEDINEQFRLISTTSLKPKPIPCDIKIIMIGSSRLYQLLYMFDEDFRKMFKVKADFDVQMGRDAEKINKYAAFIKVRCEEEGLRSFDRKAVARIVEYGSRLTSDQEKLSARFLDIADILREADYWAGKDGAKCVDSHHVEKAIHEKVYRSNLIEEKIGELINRNIIMIDTEKAVVGQVNGLAVYDMGEYMFGKPSRITVSTYMGKSGVVDIERQVKMGGSIHSKGVLILSGYLGEKFAQDAPLTLSASICFEQNYDGVDGDSASSTEAYCILSSLSGVPIKQSIAVTGSMNQHGFIQPVGGINEKIEGFYHVCKLKGLKDGPGVIIPESNVKHLMLKDEVVDAVKKGRFNIWAVATVEEGIEILTGKPAGKKDKDGKYSRGSIFYLVNKKLTDYNRKFAKTSGSTGSAGKKAKKRKEKKEEKSPNRKRR
ncbi:MAG: AAA family ATPase [Candidatus Omnitrophica bacterium]|nr:AAA family ATPase [Candidatus Omnitrophota bacterium]MDD5487541.1 AAA family ATPase [Candidatus Omnitrophota bacterium]